MCRVLHAARSGYYAYCKNLQNGSSRESKNKELLDRIRKVHEDNYSLYGSPRITHQLRKDGLMVNHKCVERLMKLSGIKAKTRRKYKQTTNSGHNLPVAVNLIERDFTAKELNEKWSGDVTYIWTKEGWIYLSVVLDLASKKVIGWHTDKYLHKELVVEAMKKAVSSRSLWIRKEGELIFHSDQGVQYASDEFRRVLINNNIMQSMSSRGDCYDNAVTESFFHSLKTEWVSFHRYISREEARLSIFHYIELFYNTRRLHSSIGYMSPVDFEKKKIMI